MLTLDNIVNEYKEFASDKELKNIVDMCLDTLSDREEQRKKEVDNG